MEEIRPAGLTRVDLMDPTTRLEPAGIVTAGYLTPPQIIKAYGIPSSTGLGVKVGIISLGGGFKQSDLNSSFTDLRNAGLIASTTATPTINQVLLDGASGTYSNSDNGFSLENTVDIYCVAAGAPAANITIYIGIATYNSWKNAVNRAISDGCHIITISWATLESDFLETSFATAAAAKIAICVASGDWGSSFSGYTTLEPCYPSSSPNVISIGGTKLTLGANDSRSDESDDNRDPYFSSTWGGGGGISRRFSLPSWQSGRYYTPIVNNVIGSPTSLSTRGIPDISAPMNRYAFYLNGSAVGAGGTSLSAPFMAGILARYQQLTGVQLSSAEYNSIFYANPNVFYDITVGTNNTQISDGYAGTTGWDCVTGLGPPIGTTFYGVLRPNASFPKQNYNVRPTTGAVYPRRTVGAR
jgi:kumamolisin